MPADLHRRHPRFAPNDGARPCVPAPLPGDGRARGGLGHRRGSRAAAVVDGPQRLGVQAARGRRGPTHRPGQGRHRRRLGDGARARVRHPGSQPFGGPGDGRRHRPVGRSRTVRGRGPAGRAGEGRGGGGPDQAAHRHHAGWPAAGARVAGPSSGAEVAGARLRGVPAAAENAGLRGGDRSRPAGERGHPLRGREGDPDGRELRDRPPGRDPDGRLGVRRGHRGHRGHRGGDGRDGVRRQRSRGRPAPRGRALRRVLPARLPARPAGHGRAQGQGDA